MRCVVKVTDPPYTVTVSSASTDFAHTALEAEHRAWERCMARALTAYSFYVEVSVGGVVVNRLTENDWKRVVHRP